MHLAPSQLEELRLRQLRRVRLRLQVGDLCRPLGAKRGEDGDDDDGGQGHHREQGGEEPESAVCLTPRRVARERPTKSGYGQRG